MMRSTPVYAPDGMTSAFRQADRFDDGLVHNHHWAVGADEAYPTHSPEPEIERCQGWVAAAGGMSSVEGSRQVARAVDWHDDGLVHNHEWAVSGK